MVTTPITLMMARCGLSQREAAMVLDVRLDTIKSWCSGRNPTPLNVLTELRALYGRIDSAAKKIVEGYRQRGEKRAIIFGIASSDKDAQEIGWPCAGAYAAMIGLVIASIDNSVHIMSASSLARKDVTE